MLWSLAGRHPRVDENCAQVAPELGEHTIGADGHGHRGSVRRGKDTLGEARLRGVGNREMRLSDRWATEVALARIAEAHLGDRCPGP